MGFLSKRPVLTAMLGLVVAVLFWAINTVVAKGVISQVPPMALSFFRWVAAFLFLLPFAVKPVTRDWPVIRKNLGLLFALAVPSVAVYNSVLYLGALYTTATNISLVLAAMPTVAMGLAWAVSKERPRPFQILGLALALAGVAAIILKGSWQTLAALSINPGDLLIVISILAWAVYSVMLRQKPLPMSPVSFLMATIVLGTLAIFPFYLIERTVTQGFALNPRIFLMFVYLGLCPSILSYICWNHGVKVLGASAASVFVYLIPVFTSGMAYVFLGERFDRFHLWGGLLILAGLLLAALNRAEK